MGILRVPGNAPGSKILPHEEGWLEGMEGMVEGGKRRIWVPPPQPGTRAAHSQAIVVDVEVVRWLPGGEGAALLEERQQEVQDEQEEEERVAEAMQVAGRLAST